MRASILTQKRARALRRDMTLPEVLLWQELRGRRLGDLRFRRQHPIGPYILDFYCSVHKLGVEVDGAVHDHATQAEHDHRRDHWLSEQGVRVLRFVAFDVLDAGRRQDVLATIAAAVAPSTTLRVVPLPRLAGEETRPAKDTRDPVARS